MGRYGLVGYEVVSRGKGAILRWRGSEATGERIREKRLGSGVSSVLWVRTGR